MGHDICKRKKNANEGFSGGWKMKAAGELRSSLQVFSGRALACQSLQSCFLLMLWNASSEELCGYTRSLSTQQLRRPKGKGMVKEGLFSTQFSPGLVLIAEGGLWPSPSAISSVGVLWFLELPWALDYQVCLVAAALAAEWLIYQAQQQAPVWAGFHWQSVPDLETFDILAGRLLVFALLGISL